MRRKKMYGNKKSGAKDNTKRKKPKSYIKGKWSNLRKRRTNRKTNKTESNRSLNKKMINL